LISNAPGHGALPARRMAHCCYANQATAPSSAINTVFIKHYVVIA